MTPRCGCTRPTDAHAAAAPAASGDRTPRRARRVLARVDGDSAGAGLHPHRGTLVQGQGDGERLLKRIEQRARALGLDSIFVLTTRTMHWFIKRGFAAVDPEWLPDARKRKYNWDRRSLVLVKKLA